MGQGYNRSMTTIADAIIITVQYIGWHGNESHGVFYPGDSSPVATGDAEYCRAFADGSANALANAGVNHGRLATVRDESRPTDDELAELAMRARMRLERYRRQAATE